MNEHLKDISEIRSMMERSSRFISLSGLSGIAAGVFALAGAWAAYWKQFHSDEYFAMNYRNEMLRFFIADALLVLVCAVLSAAYFTWRRSKTKKQEIWNSASRRLAINLAIPLVAGGIFCLLLLIHGTPELIPSATLVFYGIALLNGSKYTLDDIRYLGICEILLGLACGFLNSWQLYILCWAIGFGVLHIVYGVLMYNKYEA